MKTQTRNIYNFEELSDEAKETAISNYRESNTEIFWLEETIDSLKSLFKTADIPIKDYSFGAYCHNYIKFDLDENIYNLTKARALAWLENNLLSKLRITRSEYLKNRKSYLSYGDSYRIGYIKPCPFTGYCADDDYLDDLISNIKTGATLGDCFKWLGDRCQKLIESEYESQNSDEYITEYLSDNMEFLEDGSII